MSFEIVVLAAGQGTRMRSHQPKVLQDLAGRSLLAHVVEAARRAGAVRIHVVWGHGGERVRASLEGEDLSWVHQPERLGTGHALACALPQVADGAVVVVLYGDVPLVRPATVRGLADDGREGLALLTTELDDPTGYGRVLRDADGRIAGIVEERDAGEAQRAIREVNTGLMAGPAVRLRDWVGRLGRDNAQGEYYLTDVVALAVADGVSVTGRAPGESEEVMGINDKAQLAAAEAALRRRRAAALMEAGVTLADPQRVDLRGEVRAGRDVRVDVGVVLEGDVVLGDGARVGPYCVLRDTEIGAGACIEAFSHLDGAVVGDGCRVGPYARLRPGTRLAAEARVGNFVEIKSSEIGEGSKVNHLSYVGDATVGRGVNVGAGTITCNYDGARKHRTVIGDGAFIGSGVELVAPVEVGEDAVIGAGSTVSKPAPPGKLTVARSRQVTVAGWKRPRKD